MNVKSKEYQEHKVFEDLESYISFYRSWSDTISAFISSGTSPYLNIDTYLYMSLQGTLESIRDTLIKGNINDSYALLRKFFDSVYINTFTTLYLQKEVKVENLIKNTVNSWVNGSQQLPTHREISNYIRNSKELSELNKLLYIDQTYNEVRERCNDNTHYNFFKNVLLNIPEMYDRSRIKALNYIKEDITSLIVMHLSYIFTLNQHYMTSTDLIDFYDSGMEPPENCQYWVAPFIQEAFNRLIKARRPDIAELILGNTSMHLE
jgi:hypothetical protein